MKSLHKWAMGIVIASAAAIPALAQDNSSSDLITLSDAKPSVSASIALPANTTGVVRLDLSMASVVVTDAQDNVVFREADPRVRALELSIAPNTGTHTVTVERLPTHHQALARISSQVELTDVGPVDPTSTNVLTLDQGYSLPLTSGVPSSNADGQAAPPLTRVLEVVAGRAHTCARTASGQVHCWGQSHAGQLDVPVDRDPVIDIATNGERTCLTHATGRGRCWGASQALTLCARARALYDGRLAPSVDDVHALAEPVLQHRMALTFAARAEGMSVRDVIARLVKAQG